VIAIADRPTRGNTERWKPEGSIVPTGELGATEPVLTDARWSDRGQSSEGRFSPSSRYEGLGCASGGQLSVGSLGAVMVVHRFALLRL
jgi:hypothetical protein